jgi:glutaredoxin/glutathione-dependent peroxiredoxin
MTIKVGDKIPPVTLNVMTRDGPSGISTDDIFKGKKVAMFGVPGAFTRTCSTKHLPGFVTNVAALKKKGVDKIVCISVNDAFVMDAWGKAQNVGDKVLMVADGSARFAKAAGLDIDMGEKGYGLRSRRFSMLVDNGVVKRLHIDEPGTFEKTAAEVLLSEL